LPRVEKRFVTYGLSPQADYAGENVENLPGAVAFDVRRFGEPMGRVTLNMIGRHNVDNALAAIAVADEVGVDFPTIRDALAAFDGIGRRFELKGELDDVLVVDDYGHHPAEIQATLEAARVAYSRRLVVAFQPHRYTRTRDLFDELATSFNACHVLLVADIYAAGEDPVQGVDAAALAGAIRKHGHQDVRAAGPVSDIGSLLRDLVQPGDLVLTLGAGNIWQAGEELLVYLRGLEDTGGTA
jgi:UDP-N-acetylmuramate--alanine ligase